MKLVLTARAYESPVRDGGQDNLLVGVALGSHDALVFRN